MRMLNRNRLHLRGTGQPVALLGHLLFLVFALHVFMFNIIRIFETFINYSISSDVIRCKRIRKSWRLPKNFITHKMCKTSPLS